MKILVTGSNGFIGKVFCKYAKNKDNDVIGYDLPDYDILNEIQLENAIKNVDLVVHMAAIADLYETAKNLDMNFDVNVKGTWNVAKYCNKYNVNLCFISTCCVYGNTCDKIEEEYKTIPQTIEPYACSKMAGEYLLRGFNKLKYRILRIGTVYGEGMRESLFNFIAFEKIIKSEELIIFGDGFQTRNYIYINDLIKKIYAYSATENYFCNGFFNLFNICSNEEISVFDTIKIVESIINKKAIIVKKKERHGEILKENISNKRCEDFCGIENRGFVSYFDGMIKTFKNDKRLQEWHKIYCK